MNKYYLRILQANSVYLDVSLSADVVKFQNRSIVFYKFRNDKLQICAAYPANSTIISFTDLSD